MAKHLQLTEWYTHHRGSRILDQDFDTQHEHKLTNHFKYVQHSQIYTYINHFGVDNGFYEINQKTKSS